MKQIGFYFIFILALLGVMYLNYKKMNMAPSEAEAFLSSQGYEQIKMKDIVFFEIDLCSKSATRVRFEAVKNQDSVSGYVCVEPFYANSIHKK